MNDLTPHKAGTRRWPGWLLTIICTVLYSFAMGQTGRKGAEDARNQLPDLLDAAQQGRSTIITRHGRPVAALVPMNRFVEGAVQRSLLPLKGTGRGLWAGSALRRLRDEWTR